MGAFFVFVLWLPTAQAFCPKPGPLAQVRVQQVVDGDTLRLADGRRVRLIGINTPETGEPLAGAAKRRLQSLVKASGAQVGLRIGKQGKDRYGRTLAYVYSREGISLEAQLLSEGLGYRVAIAPNVALVGCQQVAERQARTQRLGVWRNVAVRQSSAIKKPGFALVAGPVRDVRRNRGGVWIELDSLVLRIAPDALQSFDKTQLDRLKGRRLEARGWIIDRAGQGGLQSGQSRWLLPITHPSMLESIQ